MSDYESEAMWKLYSKDNTNAVAIQTTYQRLYEAIGKDPKISIGKVKYIDFSKQFSSVNNAFWFKRKSFEYEKEVRLIFTHNGGFPGIDIPVDVDLLIDNLYVSPYAPLWFYEVIESVLDKFSLNSSILRSQMLIGPFF